jgi:hypothetical protein
MNSRSQRLSNASFCRSCREARYIFTDPGGETLEEWERNYRMDYVIQSGAAKGLVLSLRRANIRTGVSDGQGGFDTDQRGSFDHAFTFTTPMPLSKV